MLGIIPIMFLFLTLVNLYILVYAFTQSKRCKICHIALGFTLLTFIILYSLTMDISLVVNRNVLLIMIKKFQSLPVNIYIIIFFLILTGSINLLYKEKKSLKESGWISIKFGKSRTSLILEKLRRVRCLPY